MDKKSIYELSDKFIKESDELGVNYAAMIVTNGYLLDKKCAQALVERKVETAQITIDGDQASHDARRHLKNGGETYHRIVKNISEVLESTTLRIVIRVNIDEGNKESVKALIDTFSEAGLAKYNLFSMYFAPVEAITNHCSDNTEIEVSKAQFAVLETELQAYATNLGLSSVPSPAKFMGTCQAVRPNGLLVTPDGELHKCWDTVMDTELSIGTIFEPEKVATNENNNRWSSWSPFNNSTCRECNILPICSGGCPLKFVHSDFTHGLGGLPCPSWKFGLAEKLFSRARHMGYVTDADWIEGESNTVRNGQLITGKSHDFISVKSKGDVITVMPA